MENPQSIRFCNLLTFQEVDEVELGELPHLPISPRPLKSHLLHPPQHKHEAIPIKKEHLHAVSSSPAEAEDALCKGVEPIVILND